MEEFMKESHIVYSINGSSPTPPYLEGNSRLNISLFTTSFPNIMAKAVERGQL